MNVLDFAITTEREGERLFQRLGDETNDPAFKEIFHLLADAEREHIVALEVLKESVDPNDAVSAQLDRVAGMKSGFGLLLEKSRLASELKNDSDAFSHVMKAEEATIRLLEGVAKVETGEKTRALLTAIAADERKHLSMMESIYDFVEAPRTFLAWGEFSNLRTL